MRYKTACVSRDDSSKNSTNGIQLFIILRNHYRFFVTSIADEILRRDHKSNRTLTRLSFARNSWNFLCNHSEGIEGQCEEARRLSDLSKRERERQNGNRDEKRRKRSNLVGPAGDSIREFYNEVRSGGRFTFFQPPICAREAKWEHFKDGKPSGRSGVDVNEVAKLLLVMAGCHRAHPSSRALSRLQTFVLFTDAFFTGRKM